MVVVEDVQNKGVRCCRNVKRPNAKVWTGGQKHGGRSSLDAECFIFFTSQLPMSSEAKAKSQTKELKKSKAEAGWEMDLSRIRDSNGGGNRRRPGRSFTGRRSQEERARPITRDGETHRRL